MIHNELNDSSTRIVSSNFKTSLFPIFEEFEKLEKFLVLFCSLSNTNSGKGFYFEWFSGN